MATRNTGFNSNNSPINGDKNNQRLNLNENNNSVNGIKDEETKVDEQKLPQIFHYFDSPCHPFGDSDNIDGVNEHGTFEGSIKTPFYFSQYPAYTHRNINNKNIRNTSCGKCDVMEKELDYVLNNMGFIDKNIELLNKRVKMLEMESKTKPLNNNFNRRKNKDMPGSPKNTNCCNGHGATKNNVNHKNDTNHKNNACDASKSPLTADDLNSDSFSLGEPTLIIQVDDSQISDLQKAFGGGFADGLLCSANGAPPSQNPFSLLKTLLSAFDKNTQKSDRKECDEDNENCTSSSEYDSDDEYDELDIQINTVDDLIKIGQCYNMHVRNTQKKEENKIDTNIGDDKVKCNGHDIKGMLMRDGKIKYFNDNTNNTANMISTENMENMENTKDVTVMKATEVMENVKVMETTEIINDSNNAESKTDVSKEYASIENFVNGKKKCSINLETLSKLIPPLEKLQQMIGLKKVKSSIVDMVLYYLQSFESKNNNMLHTVIEGPPGVGKTELGKILGEIYAALGIIESNKFKLVKRTDLIGEFLGHTAIKTQKAIDEANGGILFIDEAYSLGNENNKDSFSKECIDIINQNLSENKKKFICIIAGYPAELDKCFFSYNPGLRRRFPFKFSIDGYKPDELRDIFVKKVGDLKWRFDTNLNSTELTDFFMKNTGNFPHFGGDIETLLLNCKFAHSRRIFGKHPKNKRKLNKHDLDIGFERFINNKNKNLQDIPLHLMHLYN